MLGFFFILFFFLSWSEDDFCDDLNYFCFFSESKNEIGTLQIILLNCHFYDCLPSHSATFLL